MDELPSFGLSIVQSVVGTMQSMTQAKRSDNIALFELKREAVLLAADILQQPCCVLQDTKERRELIIDLQKLFSSEIYTQFDELTKIAGMLSDAQIDMDELLSTYRDGDPEFYDLISEEINKESMNSGYQSDKLEHLLVIRGHRDYDGQRERLYYREIEREINSYIEQYTGAAKSILDGMMGEISVL